MIISAAAVFIFSVASAASPQVSTGTAGIGRSTYTVATLYTGDHVRDPFQAPSMGGGARPKEGPVVVDIHSLQLRGIMKDAGSEFALFSTDNGLSLVLRGGRLYDDRNKQVPGISGRIRVKQKRAELITADKDVQIYSLGENVDEDKGRGQ